MIESAETRRLERRYQAGRPYHRPANKHKVSSREDHIFALALSFGVGVMLGTVMAMGYFA